MKLNFISFVLVVVSVTFMIKSNKVLAQTKEDTDDQSISYVIQRILKDPEFIGLDTRKQIRMLIVIYFMLENFYMTLNMEKRHFDESMSTQFF